VSHELRGENVALHATYLDLEVLAPKRDNRRSVAIDYLCIDDDDFDAGAHDGALGIL
jgi:hypothetical protein